MSIIYKKSLKGVEEVALRSNGLQLRLRAYLILVDGVKSADEIQQLNPGLPEVAMVLGALRDEGYLEATGDDGARVAPKQAAPAPTVAPQADFPATTSSNNSNSKFFQARESMVREIMVLLGKDAEIVVTKIQHCENGMDLFAMMMGLKKIIAMYTDSEKSEAFAAKFSFVSTL
jgi:hypothetical protein